VIDRFRSLPVTRLSVITAQVLGQMIEQVLGSAIVVGLGLLLGWHPHLDAARLLELAGLIALGLFAFTWFGVLMGMLVRSSDAMQGVGFAIVLPLAFLAGTFVPIAGMKAVPRAIGEWDPLSSLVAAVRQVCQGTIRAAPGTRPPRPRHDRWCLLITAVCVPLALRRFRNMTTA
jgi:ABC-2 type transport system permease protein